MKSGTLLALAVAAAFSTSAVAGGLHHSTEVQTPSSVSESAPWLTGQPHLAGWTAGTSGFGSVGSEPLVLVETTEYWLIGSDSEPSAIGASSATSGSGAVGFDSSTTGGDSRHHLFDSTSSAGGSEIVVYTPS